MVHSRGDERLNQDTIQSLRVEMQGGGIGIGREIADEFVADEPVVATIRPTHTSIHSNGLSGGTDPPCHAERIDFRDDKTVQDSYTYF